MGFLNGSIGKESACSARDTSSLPGWERSAGGGKGYPLLYSGAPLVAQLVNNPSGVQETWVPSPGWEDPLEKGKAPTSVFRPGELRGLYESMGSQRVRQTERLPHHFMYVCIF